MNFEFIGAIVLCAIILCAVPCVYLYLRLLASERKYAKLQQQYERHKLATDEKIREFNNERGALGEYAYRYINNTTHWKKRANNHKACSE